MTLRILRGAIACAAAVTALTIPSSAMAASTTGGGAAGATGGGPVPQQPPESYMSIDGMQTYFMGGPKVLTVFGTVKYGVGTSYTIFGPLYRCGNVNFSTKKFYPSTGWSVHLPACRYA